MRLRRKQPADLAYAASVAAEFPSAVFKTCPWQPRALIDTGLRQWLRCCAAALRDDQVIGMPSQAVDEAWHGFILCTARYSQFCERAYGRFLHHHPDDGSPSDQPAAPDHSLDRLRRTVVAWSLVSRPGEKCVLWDLDERVGVADPWGIPTDRVAAIEEQVVRFGAGESRLRGGSLTGWTSSGR